MIGNSDIISYQPTVERIARILLRYSRRADLDVDDLVQEGLIAVWESLTKGISPSKEFIKNRMLNYIKIIDKQQPRDIFK